MIGDVKAAVVAPAILKVDEKDISFIDHKDVVCEGIIVAEDHRALCSFCQGLEHS